MQKEPEGDLVPVHGAYVRVCACVIERERESERDGVCVCVFLRLCVLCVCVREKGCSLSVKIISGFSVRMNFTTVSSHEII